MSFLETLAAIWLVMKIVPMALGGVMVLFVLGYVAYMLWNSR